MIGNLFVFVLVVSILQLTVPAQTKVAKTVDLSRLVGKSSNDIDKTLGKPKKTSSAPRNSFPIPVVYPPDQIRWYKLDRLNLVIGFYEDTPVVFQIVFSKNERPETINEALQLIGLDIQNRSPKNERLVDRQSGFPLLAAVIRAKSWYGKISDVGWHQVDVWVSETESSEVLKGKYKKSEIMMVLASIAEIK